MRRTLSTLSQKSLTRRTDSLLYLNYVAFVQRMAKAAESSAAARRAKTITIDDMQAAARVRTGFGTERAEGPWKGEECV